MEAVEQLHDLRKRVLAGEEVSATEYAVVIDNLRLDRKAGASKPKPKKGKGPDVKVDLLALMNTPVG